MSLLAACIGAFQPPREPELARIREGLRLAPRCLVFLDGAHRPRSPRYPFTWEERAGMIRAALPPGEGERIDCHPLREGWGPQQRIAELQAAAPKENVLLLSPADADAGPLPRGWRIEPTAADPDPHGERLRERLYTAGDLPRALDESPELPAAVAEALRGWATRPEWQVLREEHAQIAREQAAWSVVPYPVVLVTVDAVVRAGGHVLLIRRGRSPGKGLRALPGGFVDPREPLLEAALRELLEETRIELSPAALRASLRAVQVFDDPRRSQRGRVITHAHFFDLGESSPPAVQGGDDAASAAWVPLAELPALEAQFLDDHFMVLRRFLG
ncbi:NUDIX domain-containing protein [Ramlibacter rhizophilus]|uniref:NUDIX domain-containing protein n=1 Tax=Ramlibacter rhizophilus TaxID=1781167 RepID=A0A4Z0C076_9BURK|nr:NUDIX domain-containing protein [Ramlibacter rhizophilus]TFZ04332.1 NUDIX domain-containing protein [Ramlibacter rhizophilus]